MPLGPAARCSRAARVALPLNPNEPYALLPLGYEKSKTHDVSVLRASSQGASHPLKLPAGLATSVTVAPSGME
jgi:hypothetical protein